MSRKPTSLVFLVLLGALLLVVACGKKGDEKASGASESPVAAVNGTWKVLDLQGQETGQQVTITADSIKWETPNLSPSEGKATFTKKDNKTIEADWYGSTVTFVVVDPKTLEVTRAGAKWKLVKE